MEQADDKLQTATSAVDTNNNSQTSPQENVASQQPAETSQTKDANNDTPQQTSSAETPDAKTKKASLLDVVKNVVKAKPDADTSTAVNTQVTTKDSVAGEKAVKDDATGTQRTEEKLPFHNHPRWKELLTERDSFKSRAEQYDKVETYMKQNQLTPQEVAEGFQVMSLLKHNPVEAYKVLSGHLSRLAPLVGETLPEDIETRVNNGDVDIESAKELAKARAQANLLTQQQTLAHAERQNYEYAEKQTTIKNSVMAWEDSVKQRDPDYSAKQKFVMDKVRLIIQNEQPQSAQEAINIVERAYNDVNEAMKSFIPKRNQTVMTSSNSSVSASPHPKTLLDVIKYAAANR